MKKLKLSKNTKDFARFIAWKRKYPKKFYQITSPDDLPHEDELILSLARSLFDHELYSAAYLLLRQFEGYIKVYRTMQKVGYDDFENESPELCAKHLAQRLDDCLPAGEK